MDLKRLCNALIYPKLTVALLITPPILIFLVLSMVYLGTESVISIISYVLSAYVLTVWCFRIPYLIRFFKRIKEENRFVRRWIEDERLRVNVSLYTSFFLNVAYAVLQLLLGITHSTFWFYSLAAYYLCLALMRFFILRHSRAYRPGEKMLSELYRYRSCGIAFLLMNLALTVIIIFMIRWNRTFVHHEITTIMLAAYTFTSLTLAIINIIKYRKYNSPIYSASKAISLAAASVSVLTLESTMLTTFGKGTMDETAIKLFLGLTGGAVSIFVLLMAVQMIAVGNKRIREYEKES